MLGQLIVSEYNKVLAMKGQALFWKHDRDNPKEHFMNEVFRSGAIILFVLSNQTVYALWNFIMSSPSLHCIILKEGSGFSLNHLLCNPLWKFKTINLIWLIL